MVPVTEGMLHLDQLLGSKHSSPLTPAEITLQP